MTERLLAGMDANTKTMREDMKTMQKMEDAIHKEMTAKREDNQKNGGQ